MNRFRFVDQGSSYAGPEFADHPAKLVNELREYVLQWAPGFRVTCEFQTRERVQPNISDNLRAYVIICTVEDDLLDAEEFRAEIEDLKFRLKVERGIDI